MGTGPMVLTVVNTIGQHHEVWWLMAMDMSSTLTVSMAVFDFNTIL